MRALRIRKAALETDIRAIAVLDRYLNGRRKIAVVRGEYENYHGDLLVAESGRDIVGLVSLSPEYWNHVRMMDHLVVAQGLRRTGLGKRLVQYVIRRAGQKKCRILAVQTALWNYGAIKFYQSLGFSLRSVFPEYIGKGNDMVWLDKRLRP
jgi:ribosomal protein S18 acetylase RimI-like enzyme